MGHLHNGILLSHKKEENFTLFDSMDILGKYYAQYNFLNISEGINVEYMISKPASSSILLKILMFLLIFSHSFLTKQEIPR